MADNVALVRGLYEAWNDRNFDLEADAMAPDATVMMVGTGDVFEGPDGSRRYNEGWVRGFPDGKITVDKTVAEGDSVVVEYTGRGTHTGTLDTSTGAIPATGRSVTLKLCDVLELARGRITSRRVYFDSGSLLTQLGTGAEQKATTQQ
jgi:steroid delta-isomerase-like uncharacterized protein